MTFLSRFGKLLGHFRPTTEPTGDTVLVRDVLLACMEHFKKVEPPSGYTMKITVSAPEHRPGVIAVVADAVMYGDRSIPPVRKSICYNVEYMAGLWKQGRREDVVDEMRLQWQYLIELPWQLRAMPPSCSVAEFVEGPLSARPDLPPPPAER